LKHRGHCRDIKSNDFTIYSAIATLNAKFQNTHTEQLKTFRYNAQKIRVTVQKQRMAQLSQMETSTINLQQV